MSHLDSLEELQLKQLLLKEEEQRKVAAVAEAAVSPTSSIRYQGKTFQKSLVQKYWISIIIKTGKFERSAVTTSKPF
jgi:hypothetical protein